MLTKIFQFLNICPNLRTLLYSFGLSSSRWCPDYTHSKCIRWGLAGMLVTRASSHPISASLKGPGYQGGEQGHSLEVWQGGEGGAHSYSAPSAPQERLWPLLRPLTLPVTRAPEAQLRRTCQGCGCCRHSLASAPVGSHPGQMPRAPWVHVGRGSFPLQVSPQGHRMQASRMRGWR